MYKTGDCMAEGTDRSEGRRRNMFSALFVKSSFVIRYKYVSITLIHYSLTEQIFKKEDKACLYKSVVVYKGVRVSECVHTCMGLCI